MTQLKGKHVVIGLGKTGLSCARFLTRLGCDVVVIDTRNEPPGKTDLVSELPHVPLLTGDLKQFDLTSAQELIVSPGISIRSAAIKKAINAGVPIAGDVELFARSVAAPVIAVTGSNGKSTVVTLVGKALEAAGYEVCVAGNIGLPVLDALSSAEEVDVWVLELSSFQLETTQSLRAKVAVNLNVSEDHMDRYDSLDDYAMAKQRIFEGCESAVYWLDDHRTKPIHAIGAMRPFGGSKVVHGRFHVEAFQTVPETNYIMDGSKKVMSVEDLKLSGAHNWLNIAAVLAILTEFGVDYQSCLETLKQYPGLRHRCQWVANIHGVNWYNDSKGTNVGAAISAITGLAGMVTGKLIWLAGGEGKGADFSELVQPVAAAVGLAILYGKDAEVLSSALQGEVSVEKVETLQQAVLLAKRHAEAGDVVLLSPACASFDQFKNYEDRGEQFIKLVKREASDHE
ncbi:MAG: UDP-N-acetylmuramoyl-L-alanine--D-glutamate ligase [Ketobacter sp.]|nr:MAG: UDP-N-acetylmuramoyl-L-alanine--D-glutamate ligase [Ketobacter sp.]